MDLNDTGSNVQFKPIHQICWSFNIIGTFSQFVTYIGTNSDFFLTLQNYLTMYKFASHYSKMNQIPINSETFEMSNKRINYLLLDYFWYFMEIVASLT